jgi:hypothetical protein
MHSLYTLGYSGTKPADLIRFLDELGAVLVDVRFSAFSMCPQWTRKGLTAMVGQHRYTHLRCLGNANYRRPDLPIELANPDGAVMEMSMILADRPAILLCACAEHTGCHRVTAAEWLSRRLGPLYVCGVQHLPQRWDAYAEQMQEVYV